MQSFVPKLMSYLEKFASVIELASIIDFKVFFLILTLPSCIFAARAVILAKWHPIAVFCQNLFLTNFTINVLNFDFEFKVLLWNKWEKRYCQKTIITRCFSNMARQAAKIQRGKVFQIKHIKIYNTIHF